VWVDGGESIALLLAGDIWLNGRGKSRFQNEKQPQGGAFSARQQATARPRRCGDVVGRFGRPPLLRQPGGPQLRPTVCGPLGNPTSPYGRWPTMLSKH